MQYPIDDITVIRPARQRKKLLREDIDRMKLSFTSEGQISPIVINEEGVLFAGETRYTAAKELGWTHIEVTVREGLDEGDAKLLELAENSVRSDLPWQDQCAAVADIHQILKERNPDHHADDTAKWLNVASKSTVTRMLQIDQEIKAGNERIVNATGVKAAANIIARTNERRQANILEDIDVKLSAPAPVVTIDGAPAPVFVEEPEPEIPLVNGSFIEWASTYTGHKYNLLHCDFPYGVRADKQGQGAAAATYAAYADTLEVYLTLLDALADSMNNVVAESAHMIFWFSMDYYQMTKDKLEDMGWSVSPFPLIWHKDDNTGMLPDPNRQPRRTYETAFFCTRGDRKVVLPVANSHAHPGRDKSIHRSEKPRALLHHFFRMVVDEHTIMLDPTAGSGNAIKVAQSMGAHSAYGFEIDEEIFNNSIRNW